MKCLSLLLLVGTTMKCMMQSENGLVGLILYHISGQYPGFRRHYCIVAPQLIYDLFHKLTHHPRIIITGLQVIYRSVPPSVVGLSTHTLLNVVHVNPPFGTPSLSRNLPDHLISCSCRLHPGTNARTLTGTGQICSEDVQHLSTPVSKSWWLAAMPVPLHSNVGRI